jgi:hypothetical protein
MLCDWKGELIEPCDSCEQLKGFASAISLATEMKKELARLRAEVEELRKNSLKPGELRAKRVCNYCFQTQTPGYDVVSHINSDGPQPSCGHNEGTRIIEVIDTGVVPEMVE